MQFVEHVYDTIHGYIDLTQVEWDIFRSPAFQRLRNIRQMGLANLVFPGAEHTRLSHSLGVMHIVGRIAQRLPFSDNERQLLRLAGLLHDVGHVPTSHALESAFVPPANEGKQKPSAWSELRPPPPALGRPLPATSKPHELLGFDIISEAGSCVAQILDAASVDRGVVAMLAMGRVPDDAVPGEPETRLAHILSSLLHSQVDADRMDYLLRDAVFSGVQASGFDLPRLLQNVCSDDKADRLGFHSGGVFAIEQLLHARYANYRKIVLNKHVRSLELLVEKWFEEVMKEPEAPGYDVLRKWACEEEPITWIGFTDAWLLSELRLTLTTQRDRSEKARQLATKILTGQPMALVAEFEAYCAPADLSARYPEWSRRDIPEKLAQELEVEEWKFQLQHRTLAIFKHDDEPIWIRDAATQSWNRIEDRPESIVACQKDRELHIWRLFAFTGELATRAQAVLAHVAAKATGDHLR